MQGKGALVLFDADIEPPSPTAPAWRNDRAGYDASRSILGVCATRGACYRMSLPCPAPPMGSPVDQGWLAIITGGALLPVWVTDRLLPTPWVIMKL